MDNLSIFFWVGNSGNDRKVGKNSVWSWEDGNRIGARAKTQVWSAEGCSGRSEKFILIKS